jgi:hypothetical protein
VDAFVSEEHAASIFRVEESELRVWSGYVGRLQWRWSHPHPTHFEPLKMDVEYSSEMPVLTYNTTWYHKAEDKILNIHACVKVTAYNIHLF